MINLMVNFLRKFTELKKILPSTKYILFETRSIIKSKFLEFY